MTNIIGGMSSVYCYHFPETQAIIRQVDRMLGENDDFYRTQTTIQRAYEVVEQLGLKYPLSLLMRPDGRHNLDEFHQPVTDYIAQIYKDAGAVPAMVDFPYGYCIAGSSEAIRLTMIELNKLHGMEWFYTPKGEYEGYRETGAPWSIQAKEVDLENTNPSSLIPGVWLISNPSARNGNIISNETILRICEAGHKVVLDLAYVGSTSPYTFDVSHPNIIVLFLSFSKPYGAFWQRIAYAYGRMQIKSLVANKWFMSPRAAMIGMALATHVGPSGLYDRYHPVQLQVINDIYHDTGLKLTPSDVLLLAHVKPEDVHNLSPLQLVLLKEYKRGDGYRICLTPRFEQLEVRSDGKKESTIEQLVTK